jgi:DNA-binding SARP family transcriptional activator
VAFVRATMTEAARMPRGQSGRLSSWRTQLNQALAYWQADAFAAARACALAAQHMAEEAGESFAAGYVACQLASMALGQDDYQAAADHLAHAQLAFETAGLPPPGGALASAAQLCVEILHWQHDFQQGQIARATAEAAIVRAQRDLLGRLRLSSDFIRATWEYRHPDGEDEPVDIFSILPAHVLPALPPTMLASVRTRLARWWQHMLPAHAPPADAPHARVQVEREPALEHSHAHQPFEIAPPPVSPPNNSYEPPQPPARAPHTAGLAIYCFGSFRVYLDDVPIERWESARSRSLLKYLVARRDAPAPKELLASLFWADSEPELARRSLHQAIYCLRQTFKRLAPDLQIVQFANDHYQINPDIALWIDSSAFQQFVEQGRALEAAGNAGQAMRHYTLAVDLYGGEFLAEERYEAWAEEPRCLYQAMYLGALHRLAHYYHQQGDHSAAIMICQRALMQEDCDEESHRLLLACYGAQGLRHLAVRQYQLYVHTLQTELGLEPSTEMEAFYRQVVGAASSAHRT